MTRDAKEELLTLRAVALGAVLVLASAVLAQTTHTVREGETLSEIAAKHKVQTSAILVANNLESPDNLRIGQKIRVPGSTAGNPTSRSAATRPSSGRYVVRNGDNPGAIAHRFGIDSRELARLNPGVDFDPLPVGVTLNVPGRSSVTTRPASVAAAAPRPTAGATRTVNVRENDNDWILARRHGTTPAVIRRLNPQVRWTRLQIGQAIRVPGAAAPASGSATTRVASNQIRTRHAEIGRDDVNIRRRPSTSAAVVTQVGPGTRVTVLDREGDWYKLRFPRGTEGWVRGDFLRPLSAQAVAASNRQNRRVTSTRETRVATAPRRSSRVRGLVASNAPLETGGVEVLEKAKSLRGVRYRWGGTSRSGFDCSGFTSTVFRSQGVRLPRTSRQQATVGARVSKGELKKGDLVFFKTNRGVRINHVGIYVGNGKFIHASSGGGRVQVNSLNEGYYQRRFATARRVIRNSGGARTSRVARNEAAPRAAAKNFEKTAAAMARQAEQESRRAIQAPPATPTVAPRGTDAVQR